MWFLGKRKAGVRLTKPDNLEERREAEQAFRDSTDRFNLVTGQRGAVAGAVSSLAEVRERNHFSAGIRAALEGTASVRDDRD